jgi:Uma2 family endonuclease
MLMRSPQHPPETSASKALPTMYDLISEDVNEPGLPDQFHDFQPQLLRETFQPATADPFLIAADLNLYYDVNHPLWYKRPDWFVVLGKMPGTQQNDLRLSYIIWQEGTIPFLVVELLSPGTEAEDLGQTLREVNTPPTKWQVYEQILRIPYYVVFDRYQNRLRLFRLVATHYEEVSLTDASYWFSEIQLGLRVWQGSYQQVEGLWLRWCDAAGQILPTPQEKAERMAAKLKELGVDPEQL